MTGVVHVWRLELVESYPDLFHPVCDPPAAQGWPFVDNGWRGLLARACARIRTAVQAKGETFRATQIKETFGTLFYWDSEARRPSDQTSPAERAHEERIVAVGRVVRCRRCDRARMPALALIARSRA